MLYFRKFLIAKKFIDKREGEVSRFLSIIFCLTEPKNAVGAPLSTSLILGCRKMLGINRKNFWQGSYSNPEPTA